MNENSRFQQPAKGGDVTKQLQTDLRYLFGDPVWRYARELVVWGIPATPALSDQINAAAENMAGLRGQPERQREFVAGLPFQVRVLLCKRGLAREDDRREGPVKPERNRKRP
jgi:hypothetical protein